MRVICLSAVVCIAMASSALAQDAAPAASAAATAVKLTAKDVRALKARANRIDQDLLVELTRYFRVAGSRDPAGDAAAALVTGVAFTANPVSENHRTLVTQRKEIEARLAEAGEKLAPPRRRPASVAPPQQSRASTATRGVPAALKLPGDSPGGR